jgi:hypothetical protein
MTRKVLLRLSACSLVSSNVNVPETMRIIPAYCLMVFMSFLSLLVQSYAFICIPPNI